MIHFNTPPARVSEIEAKLVKKTCIKCNSHFKDTKGSKLCLTCWTEAVRQRGASIRRSIKLRRTIRLYRARKLRNRPRIKDRSFN